VRGALSNERPYRDHSTCPPAYKTHAACAQIKVSVAGDRELLVC